MYRHILGVLSAAVILPLSRGHGTEVRICPTPMGTNRFFVLHWHDALGSPAEAGTMNIRFEDQNAGTSSESLQAPDGIFNNKTITGSSTGWGCINDAEPALVGGPTCLAGLANWVYYDYQSVCDVPVQYTLLVGASSVLKAGCGSLYPAATGWLTASDMTPPIPKVDGNTLPWNLVLIASNVGDSNALVTFSATADDDCDTNPSVVLSHASGSSFPIGDTNVTVTATDATGRSTSGVLTITVIKRTEVPSLSPSDSPSSQASDVHVYLFMSLNLFGK
jgi:hypothetical protein